MRKVEHGIEYDRSEKIAHDSAALTIKINPTLMKDQ